MLRLDQAQQFAFFGLSSPLPGLLWEFQGIFPSTIAMPQMFVRPAKVRPAPMNIGK